MLHEKLKHYTLLLGSGSPRRQQFFKDLGLDFKISLKEVEEIYPKRLRASEIPIYLAELKAAAQKSTLGPGDILVTSDTVVLYNNELLGKPEDAREAKVMLQKLSAGWHEVITAVCFTTAKDQRTVHCSTQVKFRALGIPEIEYYIKENKPYDKAGAYGIQEWIGLVGIEEIKGSYYNVMGLPTHLVYETLMDMAG
jgi:septum formation protein